MADGDEQIDLSNQMIDDDMNNLEHQDANICLSKLKQTLQIRHLCPTAPDTLRIYPFKDSDPFVIAENNSNLDLES